MNTDGLLHQEPPVACLPPNPYHITSSASAGAGAALNSARVGMDDDALNSALGAPLGALDAPGAAAATAEWSAPLYYLSAAWHLSQADAFAGALASDLGRTVHELMHARLTAEDESALPRVFELDAPASAAALAAMPAVVGARLALWTPSMPMPNSDDSEAGNDPVGHGADDKRSQAKAHSNPHSANARAERQHQQRSTKRDQVLRGDKSAIKAAAKATAKAALVRLRQ